MKAKILAGAIAALMYGNSALAQEEEVRNPAYPPEDQDAIGGAGQQDDLLIIEQEAEPFVPPPDAVSGEVAPYDAPPDVTVVPVNPDPGLPELQQGLEQEEAEALGGSGAFGSTVVTGEDQPFGGSGTAGQAQQPGMMMQSGQGVMLFCTPVQQGTGGSGAFLEEHDREKKKHLRGDEQSSLMRDYDVEYGEVEFDEDEEAIGGAGMVEEKGKADMRGLTLMIGAGVEGYTGELAPNLEPGAAVGVTAALKPSRVLGLEFGYSGAINNLDADVGGSGPDVVRNGGHAALTLGLTSAGVQPYVLGGVGVSRYNIRNGEVLGYQDDTSASVPVGVGLRTHIGDFTADARVNYNFLFGQEFAPFADEGAETGRYMGTLNLGGTF